MLKSLIFSLPTSSVSPVLTPACVVSPSSCARSTRGTGTLSRGVACQGLFSTVVPEAVAAIRDLPGCRRHGTAFLQSSARPQIRGCRDAPLGALHGQDGGAGGDRPDL